MTISRRKFLTKTLGTLVSLAVASPLTSLAETANKQSYSLDDYVSAVIKIESAGNPKAKRYEKNLKQYSYGLGQILETTAREIESKHSELPRLGKTRTQLEKALLNPEINRNYTSAHYKDLLDFYKDPYIAVAAYNSGKLTPRNARVQQRLNELYKTKLTLDGHLKGKKTKAIIRQFQRENGLKADGLLGEKTYEKLQQVWLSRFPNRENAFALVPQNNITPYHVAKFRKALLNSR